MLTNKINTVLLHSANIYQTFYRNQMHYNYKLDDPPQKKTLIQLLTLFIETTSKSKRYPIRLYRRSSSHKIIMYIQKLHHFCNTFSPDDGLKSG